ncbi:MAG: helicase-related protein [Gemmatimonadetes bacterium]|nr:helicase-related protein [Gemmatimonadota bacterium]
MARDLYVEGRARLVDWLERQLIGPAAEGDDWREFDRSPLERYPVGVLHPLESEELGIDPASEVSPDRPFVGEGWQDDDEDGDIPRDGEPGSSQEKVAPLRRRRYVPPSSVGFSFCVRGEARLRIEASAARYEVEDRRPTGQFRRYRRSVLEPETMCFGNSDHMRTNIWQGRAGIDVRARTLAQGRILTLTLFNRQTFEWGGDARPWMARRVESSLFEVRLKCLVERGEVVDYPRVDPTLLDDEERELELQYRDRRIFAVGHGAAVDWDDPEAPARIRSDFLPRAETPIVSVAPRGDARALEMEHLAGDQLPVDLLRAFVKEYGDWVRKRSDEADGFEKRTHREAGRRITARMERAEERMRDGVALLARDRDAALAFRLANRAMLRQMEHFGGKRDTPWNWRPFQLGFLLASVASTISEGDPNRETLDLIWFQTGGGKTEAYLGLIAFLLVWRRLRHGISGGGTAVFMRYTLRLLTRQQFERAAGLICALELIRRRDARVGGRLGDEPFSVGIWVGGGVCPNTIEDARKCVSAIRATSESGEPDAKARNSLLLARCPWCTEPFDTERGYRTTLDDFQFHCTNPKCDFGRSEAPLPCRVVDESLYRHPPSLMIATIDKFARLAWEERARAFFGAGRDRRPPDLVLQDELHLISGPLGSVAGLYEAGTETAIRCRGVTPKYIASTATTRMAGEQVRALYGREVAVFPPPGLSWDDSWFARIDPRRPGRLYLGYLAPLKNQHDSFAPLAGSLLAAPLMEFRDDQDRQDLLEAWWTNVIYHGTLRGVAMSSNAFQSDVRDFGQWLIREYTEERKAAVGKDEAQDGLAAGDRVAKALRRRFRETQVRQLWSRHTAEEIAETFERLGEPRGSERCIDAVLSTNMVSVGLDVSRLAVMVVNGQPLTTGEYVQATSRVGRGDVPGIVVANYYRHQARSLSHYEKFRPYHESFYRFVEPGSVTPYTCQVRRRALHAALVIALRHAVDGLNENSAAGSFDRAAAAVGVVVSALKQRIRRACPEKADEAGTHIDQLLREWHDETERCRHDHRALHYQARDKAYSRLLYSHGDGIAAPGLWMTLHSMRDVEQPAVLKMR